MNSPLNYPDPEPPKSGRNRLRTVVIAIALIVVLFGLYFAVLTVSCVKSAFALQSCKDPIFGDFFTRQRKPYVAEPVDLQATKNGIRWFPDYVHFGPDGDTLLVSLCHVNSTRLCRIGKYSISRNYWDILPFIDGNSYLYPVFSPDGKWIVATRISISKPGSHSTYEEHQLIKMRPDGSAIETVGGDIPGVGASFSQNGKKLIYWHQSYTRSYLAVLDWETGLESQLTDFRSYASDIHRPFITPDGERFLFVDSIHMVCRNSKLAASGSMITALVKDAPLDCNNLDSKAEILWPGGPTTSALLDMDRQGRVLYWGDLAAKKKAGALAIRPSNPNFKATIRSGYAEETLTNEQSLRGEGIRRFFKENLEKESYQLGGGSALFLRKPNVDAEDEAVFDLSFGGNSAGLSPDGQWLAFIGGHGFVPQSSLGLLKLGDPMRNVRFIDWPRLDLISGSPNSPPKH